MKNWIRKIKNFFRKNKEAEIIIKEEIKIESVKENNLAISSFSPMENEVAEVIIEEFPTLTQSLIKSSKSSEKDLDKIELEKKSQPKKKHVIKKKQITHLTPKQHHSKKLIVKVPKNRKIIKGGLK